MTTLRSLFLPIVALALIVAAPALANDYPTKPVRLIVPFSPGGLNDVLGRLMATHLSDKLGKKVVVENRTGAGGVVGSEMLANATPDGYTLDISSIANALHPALYKLSYPGNKAFAPVGLSPRSRMRSR